MRKPKIAEAYSDAAEITKTELLLVEIEQIGGFRPAGIWEPMRPMVCDYCGCLVSYAGAPTHRGRCKP